MDGLDFDALFDQDMLGDDLEAWLDESFMMKRAFKDCALIAGLIERRLPGAREDRPPGDLLDRPDLRRAAPPRARPPAAALRAGGCGDAACSTWRGWASCWPASRAASGSTRAGAAVALRRADPAGDRHGARAAAPAAEMMLERGRRPDRRGHGVTRRGARSRYARSAAAAVMRGRWRRGGPARLRRPVAGGRARAGGGRPAPGEGLGLRRPRPDAAALRHPRDPATGWRPRSRRWTRA